MAVTLTRLTTRMMSSQAAYMALRNGDADDDSTSTLAGSGILGSNHSLEYSKHSASTVSIDGSSLASSLFAGDRYFQEERPESAPPSDWSIYQEERGRKLAKTLLEKSSKRKKNGLLQRAVRAFRRRKSRAVVLDKERAKIGQCPTSEDEYSDGEITFDAEVSTTDPWQDSSAWEGEKTTQQITLEAEAPPPRDLDEISDCTSDATSHAGLVEVWLPSDASSSPADDENDEDDDDTFTHELQGESPVSMPSPRRHRDHDQFFPDGLFVRTTSDEVVDKLKLGDAGHYALKRLDEATVAAAENFDPSAQSSVDHPEVIPTLVTIGGLAVPDFDTYVRQAVNSFRINVLQMSDDLYALLERRMAAKANNLVISKLRLLPFAVELLALERLMINQAYNDEASI